MVCSEHRFALPNNLASRYRLTTSRFASHHRFPIMRNYSRTPRFLVPFTRKSLQYLIVILFMTYVMLCLHELRHQHLNVQVLLRSDDPTLLISELEKLTHARRTRATRDMALGSSENALPVTVGLEDVMKNDLLSKETAKEFTARASVSLQQLSSLNQNSAEMLTLGDVHISLKTSKKFHRQRLDIILQTWFQQAQEQTYFITDDEDEEYELKTNGHLINSNCSSSHHRKALCCKMAAELDFFLLRDKKWFCHFDDDNYVNPVSLVNLLSIYDSKQDWYLGKPSIKAPLELPYLKPSPSESQKAAFWFATGGAGFCLSKSIVRKMEPIVSEGRFMSVGEKIRLPDDVAIGYVAENMLHTPLTIVDRFHSHLEPLHLIDGESLRDQVSFSYSTYRGNQMNTVSVSGWDLQADPTRFLSLHCFLFHGATNCPKVAKP